MTDITQWGNKFDEITDDDVRENTYIEPTPGWRHLYIENAEFNDSNDQYRLQLRDIQTDALLNLTYFMTSSNKQTGEMELNKKSAGTLRTLARAVLDQEKGLPHPHDIIGAVCRGEVKLKEVEKDGQVRRYPRIYEFKPAGQDWVEDWSLVENQFSIPSEDE